jgi:uncharacterized protein with ATP-grasp and redox domains
MKNESDVRPLSQRETKMNLRKGCFTRKHSSDLKPDAKEQLFFEDEFGEHQLDDFLPEYIKKQFKLKAV